MTQEPVSHNNDCDGRNLRLAPAAGVIFLGVLLIAILTPLAQFLTIGALNSDFETAAPPALAVGLLVSLVIVYAVVRFLTKMRLPKVHLVLLYTMLTIAVPLMNLGLARPFYLSVSSVYFDYIDLSNSTYRTAYNARSEDWFPVVPDRAGLAWNMADRFLRLLQNPAAEQQRSLAYNELARAMASAAAGGGFLPSAQELSSRIQRLNWDQIDQLLAPADSQAAAEKLGISDMLKARREQSQKANEAALAQSATVLATFTEFSASLLPSNWDNLDFSSRRRLEKTLSLMPEAQRTQLQQETDTLAAELPQIHTLVAQLSESSRNDLRSQISSKIQQRIDGMTTSEYEDFRNSFVFRLTRAERSSIMARDGSAGTPNNNLRAFRNGLGADLATRQKMQEQGLWENVVTAWNAIPWSIWTGPLVRWSILISAIFLFLMCLAEWFRRKWVDRENLAFPLVELADNIIRHDKNLEQAADIHSPDQRNTLFSPLFLVGCALGFLVLSLEALGHYHIIGQPILLGMNFSSEFFSSGALKGLDRIVFVMSPIVIGILFLVNLEISFSIWVIFVIYKVIFWLIGSSADLRDSLWTGYGGGRDFPFQMEQLLGATLCFSVLLIIKSFSGRKDTGAHTENRSFLPSKLAVSGIFILPVVIIGILWSMGVTSLPLLLVAAIVLLAQTIAAARARAETGLPAQHVSYDIARLPMILGMTGHSGAKPFTVFINLSFLPLSLLFRTFAQHLENLELARRFRVSYRVIAAGSLAAFATALVSGLLSFILLSYLLGDKFQGASIFPGYFTGQSATGVAHYPLWISHFIGEEGLSKFTQIHWIRIWFILVGVGVMGLLIFLRSRFLKFPLHPMGYLLLLLSLWFPFISPYYKGSSPLPATEASVLWGSALVAWALKSLFIKYGGMNFYKTSKVFFIGLVVGSIFCIFFWNILDLGASLAAADSAQPGSLFKPFLERPPYTPTIY